MNCVICDDSSAKVCVRCDYAYCKSCNHDCLASLQSQTTTEIVTKQKKKYILCPPVVSIIQKRQLVRKRQLFVWCNLCKEWIRSGWLTQKYLMQHRKLHGCEIYMYQHPDSEKRLYFHVSKASF